MNVPAKLSPGLAHVRGFESLNEEFDYKVGLDQIEGHIPDSVRGTFFRIGPGRNEIGGQKFGHWFDGDGMLHAVSFMDEGIHYRNRYVRTPKYKAETRENRIVKRSFGHNAPGGFLKNIGRPPANCANTSLIYHAGHLLALWEGGRPWEVRPDTLETVGEFDYQGALGVMDAFSAHGSVHPKTGYYYNHGIGGGRKGYHLNVYKISPSGEMVKRSRVPMRMGAFMHDFGLSDRYAIYFAHPLGIRNPLPFIAGLKSFDESVDFHPDMGMQVHVVNLDTLETVRTFEMSPFLVFHFANCWEEGDEVVVNLVKFDRYVVHEFLRNVTTYEAHGEEGGDLLQVRLNLRTGEVKTVDLPQLAQCEFPQWDLRYSGQPTRYLYSAALESSNGPAFFNSIQCADLETGKVDLHRFEGDRFTSEAVFIPDGEEEGQGYLCAMLYNAQLHRGEVVLLDPTRELEQVAMIPLKNHVPFGFHGGYTRHSFE